MREYRRDILDAMEKLLDKVATQSGKITAAIDDEKKRKERRRGEERGERTSRLRDYLESLKIQESCAITRGTPERDNDRVEVETF